MAISQNGPRNQQIIIKTQISFIMTEKEAENLCRMIRVGVDLSAHKYNYHPKTKKELINLIKDLIKERGNRADLNDIDVSRIKDMSESFAHSPFNGDISNWDVSNVEDMEGMFACSQFNGNISEWNVSRVVSMERMFQSSQFNGNISEWDVSKVEEYE